PRERGLRQRPGLSLRPADAEPRVPRVARALECARGAPRGPDLTRPSKRGNACIMRVSGRFGPRPGAALSRAIMAGSNGRYNDLRRGGEPATETPPKTTKKDLRSRGVARAGRAVIQLAARNLYVAAGATGSDPRDGRAARRHPQHADHVLPRPRGAARHRVRARARLRRAPRRLARDLPRRRAAARRARRR